MPDCVACDGSGSVYTEPGVDEPCDMCDGSGIMDGCAVYVGPGGALLCDHCESCWNKDVVGRCDGGESCPSHGKDVQTYCGSDDEGGALPLSYCFGCICTQHEDPR